jgi:hypothetical protein
MPSVHIGWAVLVGLVVVTVSTSRWRWLVLAHPVLTAVVVVVTANHWWLDGVVAVALLAAAVAIDRSARRIAAERQQSGRPPIGPGRVPDAGDLEEIWQTTPAMREH